MTASCGAWFTPAYANPCLRCEKTGVTKTKQFGTDKCDCCRGKGVHKVSPHLNGGDAIKPASWA